MKIDQFKQDSPLTIAKPEDLSENIEIEGVKISKLNQNQDGRGSLVELLSFRESVHEPIVHVYEVKAEKDSYRGFVYHKWQKDRLAFTQGDFLILLEDVREGSSTFGKKMEIKAGIDNKILLTIPEYVAHSVTNLGEMASFINMPTNFYNPENPDKFRLNVNE